MITILAISCAVLLGGIVLLAYHYRHKREYEIVIDWSAQEPSPKHISVLMGLMTNTFLLVVALGSAIVLATIVALAWWEGPKN